MNANVFKFEMSQHSSNLERQHSIENSKRPDPSCAFPSDPRRTKDISHRKRCLPEKQAASGSSAKPSKRIKVTRNKSGKEESHAVGTNYGYKPEEPKDDVPAMEQAQTAGEESDRSQTNHRKILKGMRNVARKERFLHNFKQEHLLGQGAFGKVYAGTRIADGLPVAIKYIPVHSIYHKVRVGEDRTVPAEAHILKKLDHPYIIKLIKHYRFDGYHVIIMERPRDCTDLYSYLTKRGGSLSEDVVKDIARQLIQAALYMEEMGVIHNDLKSENILIDDSDGKQRVKLIDFGLAWKLSSDPIYQFVGTRSHCPPEYYTQYEYFGREATVWSLGCVMYDLLTGEIPFQDDQDAFWSPLNIPDHLSKGASNFVHRMLQKDRQSRATLQELLNHDWLENH